MLSITIDPAPGARRGLGSGRRPTYTTENQRTGIEPPQNSFGSHVSRRDQRRENAWRCRAHETCNEPT